MQGHKNTTYVTIARFPKKFKKELSDVMRHAVLTTMLKLDTAPDYFKNLAFRIQPTGNYKIASRFENTIVINQTGKLSAKPTLVPMFIVRQSLASINSSDKTFNNEAYRKRTTHDLLSTIKEFKKRSVIKENTVLINGIDGYLIEGKAIYVDFKQPISYLYCILFHKKWRFIIIAQANSSRMDSYRKNFITILNNFKLATP